NEGVLTRNKLGILPYSQTKIDATAAGENELLYPNNDWIDQLIKDYTINSRYNLNMSGGGEKARYYLAGTYNIDNGLLKMSGINNFNNNIKQVNYNVRSNVDLKITKTTDLAVKVYAQFDDYTGPVGGGAETFKRTIWSNPVMFPAVYPASLSPYAQHPLFGNAITQAEGLYVNPYAEMVRGYQDKSTSMVQPQIEIKQDLNFLVKGLSARLMSYVRRYSYFDMSRQYNPFYYSSTEQPDGSIALTLLNGGGALSTGTVGTEYLGYSPGVRTLNSTFWTEVAANYNRTFGEKHAVTGMVITTLRNYLTGNADNLQASLPARNQGVSGRATYSYADKYLAEFNFGYNGSERFAQNNRFGFFPSFGLGYTISNEEFFKPLSKFITSMKFRATFGWVGNDAIGLESDRFFYLSDVNMNNGDFGAVFGDEGLYGRPGVFVNRYANPLITWERSQTANLGLDVIIKDALTLNIDVYKNKRTNILTGRTFIPSTMGLTATVQANTNEMESKGVDLSAQYNKAFGNGITLQLRGNFTYATNKVLVYDEPTYNANEYYRYRVGLSGAQTYGYMAERLFVDDNEAKNSPIQFGGIPGSNYGGGDIKYRDVNGDGVIDNADIVPIGLPTAPEIIYGFGGTIGYKGFDFSAFLQGSARSSFFINSENITPFATNGGSQNGLLKVIADSYWSESNRDSYAFWPRLGPSFVDNNTRTSTWWMRNGNFLRLKSVELAYNFPQKTTKKFGLGSLRVYGNATNLGVISSFDLWDPEMGGNGLGYPIQTVYNLGLQVNF
ncbi:MAG: SusC/RagA family TonB-linked outer membrane protein, partial [Sphingobacteriaceae bacterium]